MFERRWRWAVLVAVAVALATFAAMALGGSPLGRALVDGVVAGVVVLGLAAVVLPLTAPPR